MFNFNLICKKKKQKKNFFLVPETEDRIRKLTHIFFFFFLAHGEIIITGYPYKAKKPQMNNEWTASIQPNQHLHNFPVLRSLRQQVI